MLLADNFTKENILRMRAESGNDPSLLEKSVYAFGLLEAIAKVGMPFIFKGGSCLMLLLEEPKRLSTDIDILVEPGVDIEPYMSEAGRMFPFISVKEDIRRGRNNIEKRHYEFTYESPVNEKPLVILLDIVFEHNQYETLVEKPIRTSLLLTEGEDLTVKIPDINGILGDKLTAFAPHTTGVPFGTDKELEIIKQFFDCYTLQKEMTDFNAVRNVFERVAYTELGYRDGENDVSDILKDIMSCCFCIISRGEINKTEYEFLLDGMRAIGNHVYKEKFNGDVAAYMACEILYLAACLYKDADYNRIRDYDGYMAKTLSFKGARSVNYVRKVRPDCYAYLVAATELLDSEVEEVMNYNLDS